MAIDLPPRGQLNCRMSIAGGRLKPGTRVPATRQLAAMVDVSRITAVAVYDLLQNPGYIERRLGAGAFVSRDITCAWG